MKIFITLILTLLSAFSIFAQRQAEVIVVSTFLRKSPDSASKKVKRVKKEEKISLEKERDKTG